MSVPDGLADALQPIRVTAPSSRMTVLSLGELDVLEVASRRAFRGLLTPAEPIAATDVGVLRRYRGVLGTITFTTDTLRRWYPELILRLPPTADALRAVPPGAQARFARGPSGRPGPLADPRPSSRPVRRPAAATGVQDRTPGSVAGHPSLTEGARVPVPPAPDGWPLAPTASWPVRGLSAPGPSDRPDAELAGWRRPGPLDATGASHVDRPFIPAPLELTHALLADLEAGSDASDADHGATTAAPPPARRSIPEPSDPARSMVGATGAVEAPPDAVPARRVHASVRPRPSRKPPTVTDLVSRHESFTVSDLQASTPRHRRVQRAADSSSSRTWGTAGSRRPPRPDREHAQVAFGGVRTTGAVSRRLDRGLSQAGRLAPLTIRRRLATPADGTRSRLSATPDAAMGDVSDAGRSGEAGTRVPAAIGDPDSAATRLEQRVPLTVYRRLSMPVDELDGVEGQTRDHRQSRTTGSRRRGLGATSTSLEEDFGTVPKSWPRPGPHPPDEDTRHPRSDHWRRIGSPAPWPGRSDQSTGRPTSASPSDHPPILIQRPSLGAARLWTGGVAGKLAVGERPSSTPARPAVPAARRRDTKERGLEARAAGVHRLPIVTAVADQSGSGQLSDVPPRAGREMPTLSTRAVGDGRLPRGEPDRRRPPRSRIDRERRRVTEDGETAVTERGRAPKRADRAPRIQPTVFAGARSSVRDDSTDRPARRDEPPIGRETSTMYPDFTFKTLAPRIDITPRSDSAPGEPAYGESSADPRVRASNNTPSVDGLAAGDLERATSPSDLDYLVDRFRRQLERKRRIDRERRGL